MQNIQTYDSLQEFLDKLGENCLLLARHGESDWNSQNIIQGQQDRPLSVVGYRQRKDLFFMLQSVKLSKIYTSTLQRTIQTALPVSEEHKIPLEKLVALNEAKLGVFEGESKSSFANEYSKKLYHAFLEDEVNIILPGGGENLRMLDRRIAQPVTEILKAVQNSGNTLVVGHRNVNKMIIRRLLDLSIKEGYFVEHKNNYLYVFEPNNQKIYSVRITKPGDSIEIEYGYKKIH